MNRHPGLEILEGENAPRMAERTTLRLGGRVLAELRLKDHEAAPLLFAEAERLGGRMVCLGAGSNILAADEDLPLVTVRCAMTNECRITAEDDASVIVYAEAGQRLPVLLSYLANRGLSGLEGLTGIPGTVGGSLAMNAGSYGVSMADALLSVTLLTRERGIITVPRDELEIEYRSMHVPGLPWFMLLGASLRLQRKEPGSVAALMRAIMTRKQYSQPVTAASAGCVFKNPSPDMSAGKLLEEAGMKGARLGGMAFSSLHANFLVNEGGGSAKAAHELLARAKDAVFARHGVTLETEVQLWP